MIVAEPFLDDKARITVLKYVDRCVKYEWEYYFISCLLRLSRSALEDLLKGVYELDSIHIDFFHRGEGKGDVNQIPYLFVKYLGQNMELHYYQLSGKDEAVF